MHGHVIFVVALSLLAFAVWVFFSSSTLMFGCDVKSCRLFKRTSWNGADMQLTYWKRSEIRALKMKHKFKPGKGPRVAQFTKVMWVDDKHGRDHDLCEFLQGNRKNHEFVLRLFNSTDEFNVVLEKKPFPLVGSVVLMVFSFVVMYVGYQVVMQDQNVIVHDQKKTN